MSVDWVDGCTRVQTCPVCRATGDKEVLLVAAIPGGARPVSLLLCPVCGAGAYDDLPSAAPDCLPSAGAFQFYVEQGAGIDVMLGPLCRFPPERVERYLEIGCGVGFALDFVDRVFGWRARGVDPSPLARAGRELLGVDIVAEPLTRGSELGGPFDLVFCSEVIEHVADPHKFVDALSGQVAFDGALALTTPNMALIRRGASARRAGVGSAVFSALSPGHHRILFSAAALERLLKAHGFADVRVWEQASTLHAVAAHRPYPVRSRATVDRDVYRQYLADRAAITPVGTPLGLGFAYRLFKEWVNAGQYGQARSVFQSLRRGCHQAYALDLTDPERAANVACRPHDLDTFARTCPFNLTGLLFFYGIVQLNDTRAPARALEYFRAAAQVGTALRGVLRSIGADDGETEDLASLAHLHTLICLADLDPAGTAAKLADGKVDFGVTDESSDSAAARQARVLLAVFVRLVNAGHYSDAEKLAETAATTLGVAGDDVDIAEPDGKTDHELNALFCLGILTLKHRGEGRRASRLFALVHEQARAAWGAGEPGPSATALIWQSRYSQALALRQAGDRTGCAAVAESLIRARETRLPPVPIELCACARRLLT
jgi:SAM-dependent methyltransferase